MITLKYLVSVYYPVVIPIAGYMLGSMMDRYDNAIATKFKDKSALYGRELAPGEPPSW